MKFVFLVLALWIVGCGHQRLVHQASLDPNAARPIQYTVTLLNDTQLLVAVEMMGDVDGDTHIILPDRKVRDLRLNTQYARFVPWRAPTSRS